jgi:hypothetical protein
LRTRTFEALKKSSKEPRTIKSWLFLLLLEVIHRLRLSLFGKYCNILKVVAAGLPVIRRETEIKNKR